MYDMQQGSDLTGAQAWLVRRLGGHTTCDVPPRGVPCGRS